MAEQIKLLFVEDNPVTMKSLSKAFTTRGIRVFEATTLQAALDIIEQEEEFHYLICDYDLAGENGLIAAKAFDDKFSGVPIAIFTGHQDFAHREEVQKFMAQNGFKKPLKMLFKPIERDLIFGWISQNKPKGHEF